MVAHVPRLFVPGLRGPGPLTLDGEQAKRLGAVMRLRAGDTFLAFGGDGREWEARITAVDRGRIAAVVGPVVRQEGASTRVVETAIAVVRPNRMDWAIEKCTEAGADVIRPFTSAHTVRGAAEGRADRWQRLATEAAEQSGRLFVPVVRETEPLPGVLAHFAGTLVFGTFDGSRWSDAARSLPDDGHVLAVVGPEGGFTDEESALLRSRGGIGVRLGPHVLRTETAALVLTALLTSMGA